MISAKLGASFLMLYCAIFANVHGLPAKQEQEVKPLEVIAIFPSSVLVDAEQTPRPTLCLNILNAEENAEFKVIISGNKTKSLKEPVEKCYKTPQCFEVPINEKFDDPHVEKAIELSIYNGSSLIFSDTKKFFLIKTPTIIVAETDKKSYSPNEIGKNWILFHMLSNN